MARSDFESRRLFLKSLGLMLGCQYFGSEVMAQDKGAISKAKYKLGPWTGDDFTMGHKLRSGEFPTFPEKAEKKVDFIIVGGGVAGLTAAYNLKDQDFLMLEQYGDYGGNSRGSSYHGIDYSYGAAYVGPVDGVYGELYSALGLEPVLLPAERNQYFFSGQWYVGAEGDTQKPLYKEFARLLDESRPIWKGLPLDPEPRQMTSGDLKKLDASPFKPSLTGYSPEFMGMLESFCRSSFGGNLDQLSALAGYALLQDLVTPTHVFKGGNPAIARALYKNVTAAGDKRCLHNAFVWKIEVGDKGSSVVYSLADGTVHKVDCKHVIVATPPLVASRQLVKIPDQLKAQLFMFKFCAYLVGNMLMKEKLFKGKYDCFVGQPYTFADITVAETPYMMTNTYKPEMGSVLTVYQPYPVGTDGRSLLYVGDREKFAESLSGQLEKLVPGFMNSIEEIVLTRWGHAFPIVGPNYFDRLAKIETMQGDGAFTLAHSSIFGWPAAESAIRGGRAAAERAKKSAAAPGVVVK